MIHVVNVSLVKSGRVVLKDINLRIEKGEVHAIIGPNGAGKTTLLKIMAGLEKPTIGYVRILDTVVSNAKPRRVARLVGYVPQQLRPSGLTVLEYILMQKLLVKGSFRPTEEDIESIQSLLDELGIRGLADRKLSTLSGGQRMLVEIARALAHDPPVLLLDEPVSPLDPRNQHSVMKLLKKLAEQSSKTVVVVLHDLNLAANYADRVTLLYEGALVASGEPEEVINENNIMKAYGVKIEALRLKGYKFIAILPD